MPVLRPGAGDGGPTIRPPGGTATPRDSTTGAAANTLCHKIRRRQAGHTPRNCRPGRTHRSRLGAHTHRTYRGGRTRRGMAPGSRTPIRTTVMHRTRSWVAGTARPRPMRTISRWPAAAVPGREARRPPSRCRHRPAVAARPPAPSPITCPATVRPRTSGQARPPPTARLVPAPLTARPVPALVTARPVPAPPMARPARAPPSTGRRHRPPSPVPRPRRPSAAPHPPRRCAGTGPPPRSPDRGRQRPVAACPHPPATARCRSAKGRPLPVPALIQAVTGRLRQVTDWYPVRSQAVWPGPTRRGRRLLRRAVHAPPCRRRSRRIPRRSARRSSACPPPHRPGSASHPPASIADR